MVTFLFYLYGMVTYATACLLACLIHQLILFHQAPVLTLFPTKKDPELVCLHQTYSFNLNFRLRCIQQEWCKGISFEIWFLGFQSIMTMTALECIFWSIKTLWNANQSITTLREGIDLWKSHGSEAEHTLKTQGVCGSWSPQLSTSEDLRQTDCKELWANP